MKYIKLILSVHFCISSLAFYSKNCIILYKGNKDSLMYKKLVSEGILSLSDSSCCINSIKYFKQAIAIDSSRIEANYGLGVALARICYQEGKFCVEARKALEKAILIDSLYRHPYYNLGICLFRLNDNLNALNSFDKAIKYNPQHKLSYEARSIVKRKLDDCRGSSLDLEKARTLQ